MNDFIYERLMIRAEQYLKDAEQAKKLGWVDCVKMKIQYAEFCVNLASQIRTGIEF